MTHRPLTAITIVGLMVALSLASPCVEQASAQQASRDLPGLGATKKEWKQTHKSDKRRKLQKDCCYLPRVRSQGEVQDTWVAVLFGDPPDRRVLEYTRNFEGRTNEAAALSQLKREDLPADSAVAWEKEDVACKIIQYTSATFTAALGSEAQQPQIALISNLDDGPYSSSRILNAIVGTGAVSDQDITC
jgi:hypothetical protein